MDDMTGTSSQTMENNFCFSNLTISTYLRISTLIMNYAWFIIDVPLHMCIINMLSSNKMVVAFIGFQIRSNAKSLQEIMGLLNISETAGMFNFLVPMAGRLICISMMIFINNETNSCSTESFPYTLFITEGFLMVLNLGAGGLFFIRIPLLKSAPDPLRFIRPDLGFYVRGRRFCNWNTCRWICVISILLKIVNYMHAIVYLSRVHEYSVSIPTCLLFLIFVCYNLCHIIALVVHPFLCKKNGPPTMDNRSITGDEYGNDTTNEPMLSNVNETCDKGLLRVHRTMSSKPKQKRRSQEGRMTSANDCGYTSDVNVCSVQIEHSDTEDDEMDITNQSICSGDQVTGDEYGNDTTNEPMLSNVHETCDKGLLRVHRTMPSKTKHKMRSQETGFFSTEVNHAYTETQNKFIWEKLAPSVCRVEFPGIEASGFIVGSLRDKNTQQEHQYLLTCDHITLQDAFLNRKDCKARFIEADKTIFTVNIEPRVYYRDKNLDYILVRLVHSTILQNHLQTCLFLGSIITQTVPDKQNPMVIIGCQPGKMCDYGVRSVSISDLSEDSASDNMNATNEAQKSLTDFKAVNNVRKRTYGKDFYPVNRKFTFYHCHSFKGTSGAAYFSVHREYLHAMHCGSVYKGSDSNMEYGILLSHVVNDIVKQIREENPARISSGGAYLTLEEVHQLFPNIPIPMETNQP